VAVVDDNEPPPGDLRLVWWCEQYHALPEAGGMLDQDYATFVRMGAVKAAYEAVSRLRAARGDEIHSLSRGDRRVLKWMLDNRII